MDTRVIARCALGIALVAALIVLDTRAATVDPDTPSSDNRNASAANRDASLPDAAPQAFRTKYAHFRPAEFSALPGWEADHLAQSWSAFRQSCNALGRRSAWSGPCARSASVDGNDDRQVRAFLESEFVLFQITDLELTPTGVVTGYYEPLLNGRRERGGDFIFPVYATPEDLLFLDSRTLPAGGRAFDAVVDGKNVIPVKLDSASDARRRYRVEIGGAIADVRDKRMRMRIDGERIVPYFTRSEIDDSGLASARVLAWVDDPATLYAMHVQGAGRIRLEDGSVMRLAYGEQNGRPFLPPVQAQTRKFEGAKAPLARGLVIDGDAPGIGDEDTAPTSGPESRVSTRGIAPYSGFPADGPTTVAKPTTTPKPTTPDPQAEAVERMVELLMGETTEAKPAPDRVATTTSSVTTKSAPDKPAGQADRDSTDMTPGAARPAPARPVATPRLDASGGGIPIAPALGTSAISANAGKAAPTAAASASPPTRLEFNAPGLTNVATKPNLAAIAAWYARDPSYVFFRTLPNYDGGPVGALGVPLTPQRSVAVDPRTTPLGSPVFIAAEGGPTGRWSRLVFAQDTGGAIRGPVRADFFWGFGAEAGRRAGQMKQSGQMWVLLPRGQVVNGLTDGMSTRGIGGTQASNAECVVPDADFCVE